jgi:hypothetical protein
LCSRASASTFSRVEDLIAGLPARALETVEVDKPDKRARSAKVGIDFASEFIVASMACASPQVNATRKPVATQPKAE